MSFGIIGLPSRRQRQQLFRKPRNLWAEALLPGGLTVYRVYYRANKNKPLGTLTLCRKPKFSKCIQEIVLRRHPK